MGANAKAWTSVWLVLAAAAAGAGENPVAGLQPDRRPAGAPVLAVFTLAPEWRARALAGIGQPHTGLGFVDHQGAWYTPFDRPGSPGRYDIRGLYPGSGRKD